MSEDDPTVRIRHMLDHAREAIELVQGKEWKDFDQDRVLQLAVAHLIEIVGEAASRVPEGRRRCHSEIPWSKIIGMRNKLIHGYEFVEHEIVWETVRTDLEPLIAALEKILTAEG